MNENKDISWNGDKIVCKGIELDITRENLLDWKAQTGMDPLLMVEWAYNNSLQVIRDKKLKDILDD
jgi:hypothetical protein